MTTNPKYSAERVPGREHWPAYPKGFIAIRIVQLVLGVIILGLAAYGVTFLVFAGDGLTLFSAICTLIVTIYYIVSQYGAPKIYNYWAVLALDIFLAIFWLISFAILAAQIAPVFSGYTSCTAYRCYSYHLSGADLIYASCLAAAAGLGGLEFVLFVVSLAIHGVMLHRHRKAGLHNTPITAAEAGVAAPAAGAAVAPTEAEKYQHQSQAPPAQYQPGPPQPGYPTQVPSPAPQQQVYGAPVQHPQQAYYPQQTQSPLTSQPTGGSYQPAPVQHQQFDPVNGPYEAHGHQTYPQQHHQ